MIINYSTLASNNRRYQYLQSDFTFFPRQQLPKLASYEGQLNYLRYSNLYLARAPPSSPGGCIRWWAGKAEEIWGSPPSLRPHKVVGRGRRERYEDEAPVPSLRPHRVMGGEGGRDMRLPSHPWGLMGWWAGKAEEIWGSRPILETA